MTRRASKIVDIASARAPADLRGQRLGRLVDWTSDRGARVDYPENPHGPLPAKSLVRLDAALVARAIAAGREVLLAFDAEQSDRPIIVGLVEAPGAEPIGDVEARVDGKRVVLEGHDEIVLRCGAASITLRRNGRIVVRGAYVETRADGVNRIKGGSVKIN